MKDQSPKLAISARHEVWPLKTPFVISRGTKTAANVVVATVSDGTHTGRGESVPYARYGETVAGVIAAIEGAQFYDRLDLQKQLPPGAARNALDCALWELEAKQNRTSVSSCADFGIQRPLLTAFTLSLGTPANMAAAARAVPQLPLLKLKLGGAGDPERMLAVRAARPDARILADANEAWTPDMMMPFMQAAADAGIEMIEQPFTSKSEEIYTQGKENIPI